MHTTPVSLLERLRQPAAEADWARFVELYTPLLYFWGRRLGLQESDAADLTQDVLTVLVRKLPEFSYDCQKSFRSWLRAVTLNTWRNKQRKPPLPTLEEEATALQHPSEPDPAEVFAEAEYRRSLVGRALELMQAEFEPTTWKACWETVVESRPAPEVAAELGVSVGAVYVAKSRVLSRLRQELAGLLD